MRFFYNLLTYLLLVPFACYWLLRGIANRRYFDRLGQRFGFGFPALEDCIWVHAVSVGEVQASAPLVRAMLLRFPDRQLLLTTVTPTGAATVEKLFGDTVTHCYIPFEFPHAIKRFFNTVSPRVAMIMETEIWPNLYRGCGLRKIPLVLVSARISPRSVPGYRRMLPLIRETLSHGIIIAAQSEADAERFVALGASEERTRVTGNIKFDVESDPDIPQSGRQLRASLFAERPVWIAASTHEGEEVQILEVHRQLRDTWENLLLVLVPRHPERFAGVLELCRRQGMNTVPRTADSVAEPSDEVFLLDTMGEVPLFYAASDIAFVAGSLVPVGGHNLLEPAALGLPIIVGPHMFNAQEIADRFIAMDGCRMVADQAELQLAVHELLGSSDERGRMGANARQILESNRGALQRLLTLLEPLLAD